MQKNFQGRIIFRFSTVLFEKATLPEFPLPPFITVRDNLFGFGYWELTVFFYSEVMVAVANWDKFLTPELNLFK